MNACVCICMHICMYVCIHACFLFYISSTGQLIIPIYCREMKFYKKGNGKLSLLVDAGVSLRTPWPVKTASAREYDATVK